MKLEEFLCKLPASPWEEFLFYLEEDYNHGIRPSSQNTRAEQVKALIENVEREVLLKHLCTAYPEF